MFLPLYLAAYKYCKEVGDFIRVKAFLLDELNKIDV